jgi:hypothetical protein
MKITETITHQDGTTSTKEIHVDMAIGKTSLAWTLYPTDEEPISVRILESGWNNMYHVLTEYGAYEETSYSHLDKDQLLERFPEFKQILENLFSDVVITGESVQELPNDSDLGKFVRSKSIFKL